LCQTTIIIENVYPELDGGRYAVKREVGEWLDVWADIFKHGHDAIAAMLKYRRWQDRAWQETPMRLHDNHRWTGRFFLAENTRYRYTIEAFQDVFGTWREELAKKVAAGQAMRGELREGEEIIAEAVERATGEDRQRLADLLETLRGARADRRTAIALDAGLAELMGRHPDRVGRTVYDRELEVVVDREQARFAAWYEMFPRSQGTVPGRSATLRDCERRLPAIAALGFDVVYLPPIHPIGRVNRKGPNNALEAGPDDPGCPYAIGSAPGGHKAIDPQLGTLADFERFVQAAADLGIAVALDYALQCAPDHPYASEHPEWFYRRPDGTIKFAENPPKKYEDIYPLDLLCPEREALWEELKSIVLFWIERGVKVFRVDNPHTKPVRFWQWLIREVQREHPETIFLAEAFTHPKMMKALAKAGFTQSYTYFIWRNDKAELAEYFTELTQSDVAEYMRGNLFTNTPDILPWILQQGGRPAFKMRLVLAATLSSLYGIYNGFELCENVAMPGKEEYCDSEKYEYKVWDWDRPGNIKDFIAAVNRIRRENPALHYYKNLRLYWTDNEQIIAYGKMTPDKSNVIVVVVNLDPYHAQEATISVPIWEMGIPPDEEYLARELLTGADYYWRGDRQYVRLDPQEEPAHILALQRRH